MKGLSVKSTASTKDLMASVRDIRINIKRELDSISSLTRRNRNPTSCEAALEIHPHAGSHSFSKVGGLTCLHLFKWRKEIKLLTVSPVDLKTLLLLFSLSLFPITPRAGQPPGTGRLPHDSSCYAHSGPVPFWLYQDRQWRANHFKVLYSICLK